MAVRRPKSKNPLSPLEVLNVSGPKKEKAPKPAKTPNAAKTPAVTLDFPLSGEQVRPGHYAVRIAAKPEVAVEISVDGGPWQPCREAVGYYWYDWTPSEAGAHTLVARSRNGGSRYAKTEERSVFVVGTPSSD